MTFCKAKIGGKELVCKGDFNQVVLGSNPDGITAQECTKKPISANAKMGISWKIELLLGEQGHLACFEFDVHTL